MIQDLWFAFAAWVLRVLQWINNIHRQFGLWTIVENWKALLCSLVLFVIAAYGGNHLYKDFRRHRLLANANAALEKDDARDAAFFAMKLLRNEPDNVAAAKIMTRAAEKHWPRQALYWFARVDTLQPGDTKNCLEWAHTALALGDASLAASALDKIHPTPSASADYEWLAGHVALKQDNLQDSVAHLAKAAALDPANADYAFELAKVRLRMPDQDRKSAEQALEKLAADPKHRPEALEILFRDAVTHRQAPRALDYFSKLRNDPGLTSADRMLFLNFLLQIHHPTLTAELLDYEKSIRSPQDASNLIFWMNGNNMSVLATTWVESLPQTLRDDPAVQLATAESYVKLRDWPRLKTLLDGANWKDTDFMRAALLARCLGEQGDAQQSLNQWNLALLKAADHPDQLARLCEVAFTWGWRWESQAEELAWRVAATPSPSPVVLSAMQRRFITTGDTEKLYRLLTRMHELSPSDRTISNNFALVSLLLGKNDATVGALAKAAYASDPSDAFGASTYAFYLYQLGQKQPALALLSHYGVQLRSPSVAVYYGVILAACGDTAQARDYIRIARAGQLLPEERRLADAAASIIGLSPDSSSVTDTDSVLLKTGTSH